MNKEHKDPDTVDWKAPAVEETSEHCVLGRFQTCSKERIKVLTDAIERDHLLQYTPSLLYPEGHQDGNWRNHIRESICVTPTASEDFFFDSWMKELGSEVAEHGESSQQTQPKTTNPTVRTGRPRQNNRPVRVLRKSTKVSHLVAKAPMKERGDLFLNVCQCLLNVR